MASTYSQPTPAKEKSIVTTTSILAETLQIPHENIEENKPASSKPTPNVFLVMSNDPEFRIKAKLARKEGKKAELFPGGWGYESENDALEIASEHSHRNPWVQPHVHPLADDLFKGSDDQRSLARKKIKKEIDREKNNKDMKKLTDECKRISFKFSLFYLSREDAYSCLKTTEQREIYENLKHQFDKVVEDENRIALQEKDIEIIESIPQEETPEYIHQFNKKHAVIHQNQTYILTEKYDPTLEKDTFSLENVSSFNNWHKPLKDKTGKQQSAEWLAHPKRRQYPGGIIFDPEHPGHYGGYYNLFKGFKVEAKKGCCDLFWQLVDEVLTSGDKNSSRYIRKWLAHLIQRPWELPEVALVFRGLQGTGKGTFIRYVSSLVSSYYLELAQMGQVVGRFNSHLKDVLLVYANEAVWGGNKAEVGALKAMITDPLQAIEQKSVDIIQVKNCKRLIVSSNEDWAVPVDIDDRRFLICDVDPKHKEDETYFARIFEQMEKNGGLEALMWDLKNENISNWHPRKKPRSASGFDLKVKSMKTPHLWLYEALSKEQLDNKQWAKTEEQSKERIYQDYRTFCASQEKKHDDEGLFWKLVKQVLGPLNERKSRVGEVRIKLMAFPGIEDAKVAFEKFSKEDPATLWGD